MWRRKKWLKSFIVVVITIVFLEWKFSLKVLSGVLKYRNGRCYVVVNDAFYENYIWREIYANFLTIFNRFRR